MNKGIQYDQEVNIGAMIRDTSPLGVRLKRFFAKPEMPPVVLGGIAMVPLLAPGLSEICFSTAAFLGAWILKTQKSRGLPMQVPLSAKTYDPKEFARDKRGNLTGSQSKGIIYLGNDQETKEEIWITDTQARTHMMYLGTTGSGKTEFLLSTVFNGLIHGSGFIYVDGKADNSLYGKIYSMARRMGREHDVLLINFQTGAKDIFGAQPRKMSNTMNPFAVGSSGMLTQLVVGLMSGGQNGKSDVWSERAISFVEALIKPLVYLRDYYGLLLDVEVIRNYFNLEPLVALVTENMERTKNSFGADEWKEKASPRYPGLANALSGLASYIDNLPGYNHSKPVNKQEGVVAEQHGYITMQLVRTFNSLSDTYAYIMKTPLAEIDFYDVFINRRILVVLLPALEKSPPELTNLGRIIVASIKATMAVGLGADVEGEWSKVIDAKPTTAPSPFACTLDEYGYYAVEGFAVVPAQARSLGFSAIFAGQDLPAFEKASESEAKSTLANTTTKFCGKLECTKTFEYFSTLAGEGYFTKTSGFQNQAGTVLSQNYMDTQSAQVEKISRLSLDVMKAQISGQWHMFFADRIIRINSFYSNPKRVKHLRTNHFIASEPPLDEHARMVKRAVSRYGEAFDKGCSLDKTPESSLLRVMKAYPDGAAEEGTAPRGLDEAARVLKALFDKSRSAPDSAFKAYDDAFSEDDANIFDEYCEIEGDEDPIARMDMSNVDFTESAIHDEDSMLFGEIDEDEGDSKIAQAVTEGLLARNRVEQGLAAVEAMAGRPESVARTLGSASASLAADATRYPVNPPSAEPDIEDFIEIASSLQEALGFTLEKHEE